MSADEIFNDRKNKFLRIGRNKGFINNLDELSALKSPNNNFDQILKSKKLVISSIILIATILAGLFFFL